MQRALELATFGKGNVSPNPMVGCVIIHQNKIIGEGYHKKYGEHHAEVNAINSVADKNLLKDSQLYVTLEPCSHFGKTPPCSRLIIEHGIPSVYVALKDPNPLVAGKGLAMLRNAGVNVNTGLMAEEAAWQNRRFLKSIKMKLPYIILKWAETADGFTARNNYDSKWISNNISRALVHKWRAEEDAIMVGSNTAKYDNPKLNVRDWHGNDPTRIVIDRNLILDGKLDLFDGNIPTFLFHSDTVHANQKHHRVYGNPLNDETFIEDMLKELYNKNIRSVLVEGGTALHNIFIKQNLWNEARVFKSTQIFGEGINAPSLQGRLKDIQKIGSDKLFFYLNERR